MWIYVGFFLLVVFQSMTFTFISRARNRNHLKLATIASVFSNVTWIVVFRHIVLNLNDVWMYVVYVGAMTVGTLIQMKISMWIEKLFKCKADG